MTNEERRVADLIREAFRGVTLGEGIGLMEAQGIDDYADAATRAQYRAGDEKEDWAAISAEKLERCYSSLSFFDPQGMRFHLPPFLIAELRGAFIVVDLVSYLPDFRHDSQPQFEVLSHDQREAVQQYRCLRERENDFDRS